MYEILSIMILDEIAGSALVGNSALYLYCVPLCTVVVEVEQGVWRVCQAASARGNCG